MNTQLRRAIEGLYDMFSAYEVPERVDLSPYRDPEREVGAIRRKGLGELTADDLTPYSFHALTTVEDEDLFRYVLPRMLELVAEHQLAVDPEIVMGKLAYGGWRDWPDHEQEAVDEFLMAWWLDTLEDESMAVGVADVLGGLTRAGEHLSAYLTRWETHPSPTATDQLAAYLVSCWDGESGVLDPATPFLEGHPVQVQQLRSWLLRPVTLQRLERGQLAALERGVDDERYDHYGWATEILRVLLSQGAS